MHIASSCHDEPDTREHTSIPHDPQGIEAVEAYWDAAACGEELYPAGERLEDYDRQAATRYELEPYISPFAEFERYRGLRVLEIGVGSGADHQRFAEAGAELTGIDLTERAIRLVRQRLALRGLSSDLRVGTAEKLDFPDGSFDLVYSWGVLHHTPDTAVAISEVFRVLKPGGEAKVMIYHKHSFVGYMLWLRYALSREKPRTHSQRSTPSTWRGPGTKAYTVNEARLLFSGYDVQDVRTELTHADLLTSPVGQGHRGPALDIARRVWPRWLIKKLFPRHGLFLMVCARKPAV